MFIVYQSNELNVLLSKVYQIIQKKPLSNVFEKEIFIHDNKVLFQYLNIFIANQTGISASFKLYHPNDFIWQLLKKFSSKIELKNIFTQSIMTWKIMKILNKKRFSKDFYTTGDNFKKFKFSFLIAQIFEQYLVYRPNWISSWEVKQNKSNIDTNYKWQLKLWMEIINENKKNNQSNDHFSNLFYSFQKVIDEKKINKKDWPERCFVISCFSLNPSYIKMLKKISAYIHIYFLYITPCKKNIFNLIEKNELFPNKTTEHQKILNNSLITMWGQYEKIYELYILKSKNIKTITYFKKNKNNNLLNSIKNNFLKKNILNIKKIKKKFFKASDNSISIHICFNKKNEIEILHKKLLVFFLENPNIKAHDIVVTSFRIDSYIPYINAVFKSSNKKEQIPFFISKIFSKKTEIIFSTFIKILNISYSRFQNEEILNLLDIPEIAKKFNISEEEINILYNWIEEANIRWAVNEKHKNYLSFPKHHQNTWLYGIEKLILSYAMNNTENIWNHILPCSFINGSRIELVEKLIIFIKTLEKWQKKLSKSQHLIYWRSLSKDLISDFFYNNEKIESVIQIIQANWREIINDGLSSNYLDKISINILKEKFIYKYHHTKNQKFLPGVVNFCHPMSICYIPFKIICIIGSDHYSIPKKNNMDDINLLNKYPLIGDVDNYQRYCYLFLQMLSCSETYFYISYVGYSIKDNSKVYASILVDQLLNYIALNFCLIGDQNLSLEQNIKKVVKTLCIKYKKNYFYEKHNINYCIKKNFRNTYENTEKKQYDIDICNVNFLNKHTLNQINLMDLIAFWKHPIRYFVKNTLKIQFNLKKQEINTTEPFSINKLDTFKIRDVLLKKIINNQDTEELYQYYTISGKLPYDFFGKIFWNKNFKEMKSIAQKVIKYRISTKEQKINLKIKNYQINGILYEIQRSGLLRWKSNLIYHSDRISLWLEHLIYCILGGCGESKIIGYKNTTWTFFSLEPNMAYNYLLEYIEGYIEGIKTPLLLTRSGSYWLDQVYDKSNNSVNTDNNTKTKGYKKLLESWTGHDYIQGEKEDFYIKIIIRQLNENNIKEMCKIAKKWLIPILNNTKK